ncbi:MAG: hypothetical protein Q8P20_06610 [bacterium]|nr:hypothetical protein [bacterium]
MDEYVESKGPGFPIFRLILVIGLILLVILYWEWLLNNAVFFGAMSLFLYGWAKSEQNGWLRAAFSFLILLIFFGMNFGESWYIKYQSLPWFYGFHDKIAEYTNYAPAFFMTLALVFVPIIIRFLGSPTIGWVNSKEGIKAKLPAYVIGLIVIAFSVHTAMEMGAYLNMSKGSRIGSIAVGAVTKIGSTVAQMGSESLDNYGKDNNAEIEIK